MGDAARSSSPARPAVRDVVADLHRRYYPAGDYSGEIERQSFNVSLVRSRLRDGDTVCDIGAGWGLFATACAAVGLKAIAVDDRGDAGFNDSGDKRLRMPADHGVRVIARDVVTDGLDLPASSVHAFTSFDSMEHWHQSPKRLFHQMMNSLVPGGLFILGVPNASNLRKRVEAVLGQTEWSSMGEWYERPQFRSHVREPNVRDLRYIARDLGLGNVQVIGRNYQGLISSAAVRIVTRAIDRPLRLFPTLCADIYLVAEKPR